MLTDYYYKLKIKSIKYLEVVYDLLFKYEIKFSLEEDDLTIDVSYLDLIKNDNYEKFLVDLDKLKNTYPYHVYCYENRKDYDILLRNLLQLALVFNKYTHLDYNSEIIIRRDNKKSLINTRYLNNISVLIYEDYLEKFEFDNYRSSSFLPINCIKPNQVELNFIIKFKIINALRIGLMRENEELENWLINTCDLEYIQNEV